jgi:HEAT repeat protein
VTPEQQAEVDAYFFEWWAVVRAARAQGLRPDQWKPLLPSAPVEAMQAAALGHAAPKVRRAALGVLDHDANDESTWVFRTALADPVPRVRIVALHGLACERCRTDDLCVADVVPTLLRTLREDASPKVRHAVVATLVRLAGRDDRVTGALQQAAADDPDPLVRHAAGAAVEGRFRAGHASRKALRRRQRAAAGSS